MTAVDDRERDDEVSDYKRERMETNTALNMVLTDPYNERE
jgi:hypothetical protein